MANSNETPDYSASFDQNDIQSNRLMAALSYIGILFLIPLFAAKESPYARFHCNQGFVLFLASLIANFAYRFLRKVPLVGIAAALLSLAVFVLAIVGIVNAAQGKAKELPLIGGIQLIK